MFGKLFDRLTYFEPTRFEFPDLKQEQKNRAQHVLDWSKAGLPKTAFAYMGASEYTLETYIRTGKLTEFFPMGGVPINSQNAHAESFGIMRVNISPYPLTENSFEFIRDNDAVMLARSHFILQSLGLPINPETVMLAKNLPLTPEGILIQKDLETLIAMVVARDRITGAKASNKIFDFMAQGQAYKGYVLALSTAVDKPEVLYRNEDPYSDQVIISPGFEQYILGLEALGEHEKSFLKGIGRATSKVV
jgi:hypothetical protein